MPYYGRGGSSPPSDTNTRSDQGLCPWSVAFSASVTPRRAGPDGVSHVDGYGADCVGANLCADVRFGPRRSVAGRTGTEVAVRVEATPSRDAAFGQDDHFRLPPRTQARRLCVTRQERSPCRSSTITPNSHRSRSILPTATTNRCRSTCQCGRCRGFFRAGSGLVPRTFGDWWASPPCSADPVPLKQVS